MPRAGLTLLLLLHYLLVVCASVSERAAPPEARAFHYVHRADCQLKNAWRGGSCFDDCNGVQYQVQKGPKTLPLPQLLALGKGLDVHCLARPVAARPGLSALAWPRPAPRWPRAGPPLPTGFAGRDYPPPQRG